MEIPGLARKVADTGKFDGIVCLGAVIRGAHAALRSGGRARRRRGVGALAAEGKIAVAFGVLACDNIEQAVERAGAKAGNRGADAAMVAVEMADLYARIEAAKKAEAAARQRRAGADDDRSAAPQVGSKKRWPGHVEDRARSRCRSFTRSTSAASPRIGRRRRCDDRALLRAPRDEGRPRVRGGRGRRDGRARREDRSPAGAGAGARRHPALGRARRHADQAVPELAPRTHGRSSSATSSASPSTSSSTARTSPSTSCSTRRSSWRSATAPPRAPPSRTGCWIARSASSASGVDAQPISAR